MTFPLQIESWKYVLLNDGLDVTSLSHYWSRPRDWSIVPMFSLFICVFIRSIIVSYSHLERPCSSLKLHHSFFQDTILPLCYFNIVLLYYLLSNRCRLAVWYLILFEKRSSSLFFSRLGCRIYGREVIKGSCTIITLIESTYFSIPECEVM